MDPKREQILQQLRNFAEKGGDTEEFIEVMRQAWSLRPPPWELLRKVRQQHWGKMASRLKQDESNVQQLRQFMARWSGPSERAQDPDDPVGAAARAIRAALPEFQTWQVEAVVPETQARFHSHEEPQYRAALRLQLADIRIPAALGGVYYPWPEIPEGTGSAHLRIFLEPWATARSGRTVEMAVFTFPPSNEEPQPPPDKPSTQS